jgi:uncharacterized protein (DUF488 family)
VTIGSIAPEGKVRFQLFTIGVYGKTEEQFFGSLADCKIDSFCDVRRRRGMRGPLYAFANSARLQARLSALGIRYYHFRDLAPSDATRQVQRLRDESEGVGKRSRTVLSSEFKKLYSEERLSGFDSVQFLSRFKPPAERLVLFCVEADPQACHRSILAERLSRDLNVKMTDL